MPTHHSNSIDTATTTTPTTTMLHDSTEDIKEGKLSPRSTHSVCSQNDTSAMKRQSFEATSTKTASGSPNSEGVDVEATKPTQIATTTTNSVPAIVMPVVPDAPITPAAATTTTSETSSAGEQVTEVQLAGITLLLVRKGSQITYRLPQHQPIASLSSAQRTTLLNAIRRIHPNRIPSTTATTQQQQQTTKGTKTTATSAIKSAIKPLNRSKARQERPLNPKLTSSHDTAIRSPTLASHSRSLSTPLLPSPTRLVAIAPRPTSGHAHSLSTSASASQPIAIKQQQHTTSGGQQHGRTSLSAPSSPPPLPIRRLQNGSSTSAATAASTVTTAITKVTTPKATTPTTTMASVASPAPINPLRRRPDADEVTRQRRVKRAFARTLLADHRLCIPVLPVATAPPTESTEDAEHHTSTTPQPIQDPTESEEALHWRRPFTDWKDAVDRLLPWHTFQYVEEDLATELTSTINTKSYYDDNAIIDIYQQYDQLQCRFMEYMSPQTHENTQLEPYQILAERLVIEEEKSTLITLNNNYKHGVMPSSSIENGHELHNNDQHSQKKRRIEKEDTTTMANTHKSSHSEDEYDDDHDDDNDNDNDGDEDDDDDDNDDDDDDEDEEEESSNRRQKGVNSSAMRVDKEHVKVFAPTIEKTSLFAPTPP